MADSKDMNTFDNKSYVNDGNETRVNNRKLSIGEKLERSKTKTVFADLNEEEIKTAKRGILRNVIIISLSFMLLFTAYQSMASLQSSINKVSILSNFVTSIIHPHSMSHHLRKTSIIESN